MQQSTNLHSDNRGWREDLVTVLAALPYGTWTSISGLAALTGHPADTIAEFLDAACPTGYERVLTDAGGLRRSMATETLSSAERIGQLERVGISFTAGRADRAHRLGQRSLTALRTDPATGVLPDGTRREWPDQAVCNTTAADRERLLALTRASRWQDIATHRDLVRRAGLPQALKYAPARLFAAVTVAVSTPIWPIRTLAQAGLADPGETAERAAVHLFGLRSLEADSVVEVYTLVGPTGAVPVLVQTRPMPAVVEVPGHRTPCHRGRHDQCRGRYDHGGSWCPCQCGCTGDGRATTARYLTRGDDFEMPSIRRSIVRANPRPDGPDRVRLRTRDWFSGTEGEIGYGQNWIAFIHNPRRRSRFGA